MMDRAGGGAAWGTHRTRLAWAAGAAFLGALAVLLGYYYAHKPISPPTAAAIALAVFDIVIAAAILVLAGGLGHLILPISHPHPLANLAVQAALGLGVLALVGLGAGALGLITPAAGWIALAGGLVALARHVAAWCAQWSALPALVSRSTGGERRLAALLAVLAAIRLAQAAAPPIQFDALVYHLLLPKMFLAQHSIALTPEVPYWGNPLGGELLYTWAMALARPQAAAILGWMIGIVASIGVLGLGASLHRPAGWMAVGALLAGESLAAALGWAYVDWWGGLYGIALLTLLLGEEGGARRVEVAAGLLAGFAFGTKYTAGVLFVCGLAALWAMSPRDRLRRLAGFSLAALAAALPWLVKNWIAAGTPLYPFVGSSPWLPAVRQAALHASVEGGGAMRSIFVPLAATLLGHEKAPGFSASIGPLLLGLAFGAPLVPRRLARATGTVALFVAIGWLVWAVAGWASPMLIQTRLYFSLLPGWAVLAGLGAAGLSRIRLGRVRVRQLVHVLVGLTLALGATQAAVDVLRSRPMAPILGIESEGDYRLRNLGAYELAMREIAALPEGRRVLMLWEPRAFECWPRCSPDAWIDRWYVSRRTLPSTEAVAAAWEEDGYTDVLVNVDGASYVRANDSRYTDRDWDEFDYLVASLPVSATFGEGYRMLRLP